MDFALELIKILLPAGIVFATAYTLVRNFLNSQRQNNMIELRINQQDTTLPLRLQAYERMTLFCERINLLKLMLRVGKPGMDSSNFKIALIVAIEQEFDHNVTQQMYMSAKLWQIIVFAKEEAIGIVSEVTRSLEGEKTGNAVQQALIKRLDEEPQRGMLQAQAAIKEEVRSLF